MIEEISVIELQQKLHQNEDIFLLDVRQPDEYAAFNIKGHLIPLPELPQRLNELPKNKPIVVICRSGKRSDIAGQMLKAHGFNDVKNLAGGLLAWQEANT